MDCLLIYPFPLNPFPPDGLYTGRKVTEMNKLLPRNEHPAERIVRIAAGAVLIGAAAMGALPAWGYIGAVPLLTGLIGSCPLYTLLGFSTCPLRQTQS
jgi:hypothetical protein